MKQHIKKHWLVSIILILSIVCITYNCFEFTYNQNKVKDFETKQINYCKSANVNEADIDYCKQYLTVINEEKDMKVDFYTMMSDVLVFRIQFFNILAFLIIVIPTLVGICKMLKTKYIIFFNNRGSYKSFLKIFFAQAYRYIWLLPVIAGTLILICMFNTTFNPAYALKLGGSIWDSNIIYYPIVFITLYLLNILMYYFHSLIYL